MFRNKFLSLPISKFELALRLIFYSFSGLILISFLILVFFLYQRFYLTLTQAEEIIVLKSQLALDTLNLELFRKIENNAARQKKSSLDWAKLRNPFLPFK